MSEDLVKKVQDMLKEETWTRASISNYTKNNLIELAGIVDEAKNEGCIDEVKAICDKQRDSIIALYISGMLSLKKGSFDNQALNSLVDIFEKNHKVPVVIYLCETILAEDATNKFALRTLARCYSEDKDNGDKVWDIYEKIVKLDFEEADIAKLLAEHFEAAGNTDKAVDYYKKALLRYVNAKNSTALSAVWTKLVAMVPHEFDFFMLVQRKVAKTISPEKSIVLMQELYVFYKNENNWDVAIDLLKRILTLDPKDNWARREISDCFRAKYADHSQIDEYIRNSNLNQNFRNVWEAINDFEKHIAFDVRRFVFHRTWHVGIIQKVQDDILTIKFGGVKEPKEMSLKMAIDALQPLSREHIWVIKATTKSKSGGFSNKEGMIKKIKTDKAWTLKTIIKSFNNSCDLKRIKAELVPSLLTPGEWTSWNTAAKKVLESDSTFSVNQNNINEYIVREHEITAEEKLSEEFKAQKQFFPRVDIIMRYVNDEMTDKDNELLLEMINYFASRLKSINAVDEEVVASYLVIQKLLAQPELSSVVTPPSFTFEALYREIENPREMYSSLKDTKNTSLRADFLECTKMLPDWVEQYVKLFPTVLSKDILTFLIANNQVAEVKKLAALSFEDYRGYRDAALYFFENSRNESWWFKDEAKTELLIPMKKQLISILNIIEQAGREIDNHVDTTENRKVEKKSDELLFKTDTLINFMLSSDMDTLSHLYTMVDENPYIDSVRKAQIRNRILEKYPDYKFRKTEEKSTAPKGMLVTAKMLKIKQDLEKDMQTVQIPAIAKEVAEAKEKGDLKENAEYIAAKEAQHKLSNDLKRLEGELARAVVYDPTTATTSLISFGTEVTLLNKDDGKEETYTILGPWESNPEAGIISYISPFGDKLMDNKVGDELTFTINGHKYNYLVKEIKLAKI